MKIFLSLIYLLSSFFVCYCSDKIKLSEVSSLTLYANRKTNGRRSPGVPQLECVGGSAHCDKKYTPTVVQCTNVGTDGYDAQWKCQADLESTLKFGTIDVSCEGYDYPNDQYVLKGSCGLRYTLDRSSSHSRDSYNQKQDNYHKTSSDNMSNLFFIILIVIVIIGIICWYNTGENAPRANAPPPPGFRPEFTDQAYYHTNQGTPPPPYSSVFNDTKYGQRTATNDGPGFWTGLGAGGVMGYLFGSGTHQRNYTPTPSYGWTETSRSSDNWNSGSSRSHSPEFRSATGYGGTSRR